MPDWCREAEPDSFLQQAFTKVCTEAKKPEEGCYVVLVEVTSYYGGPEEGGWWGHDSIVRAFQRFPNREQAEVAAESVRKLAEELSAESLKAFGEQCLRESAWLEARGLDDSFLPEPDGESKFEVEISDSYPENSYGPRHYE